MKMLQGPAVVTFCAAAMCGSAAAQQPWQKMQMPKAADVAKVWVNPPSEYGPEPYFGMNGGVTIESLTKDLDTMKSLGFHAVTAQAGGGMSTTYLSPEYFAFFKQFVEEAKKRDMRVWIVDDIGYPSGFAGGIYAKDKANLQMQALTVAQRLPVVAGAALNQPVGPEIVAATAVSASGQKISVPVTDGAIKWTAPAGEGDWTVLAVSHVNRTSPTKSDTNPKHTKDSSQPLEDYLDPTATAAFIQATHEGYFKAMPEEFGRTIMGFRGDEPDYSISGLPWTPALFATCERVKGYDVRPYLVAMLNAQPRRGETPMKLTDTELRAKGDYYDVFAQMFRDGFFKPQGVWCAQHKVEYQVHLNHEELQMDLTRSEGEFFRDMQYVEVPGIDTIWHQIFQDTVSDFPRLAASVSHVYGKPRAFTESFAAYRPAVPNLETAAYVLNEQLVRGINLFETMFYPATNPSGTGRGGPMPFMKDPGWPGLMEYIRRMSYVTAMGRPAAEVALYLPSDSMWVNDAHADEQFVATERLLSEHQVDFDIVNGDALAKDLKAGKGTLETASGNAYRTVIVPAASVMSDAAVARLKAFAAGGGHVVFVGRTPGLIYGRAMEQGRAATADEFAFGTLVKGDLPAVPTPPMQPPDTAPGPMVVPEEIVAAVMHAVGPGAVQMDQADPALKVMTRRLADAGVFLFFNEGAQASSHTVTLRGPGSKVEIWDAASGTVTPVNAKAERGSVAVTLELKPYATELLVVR
jgi:hypothetical protein